MTRPTILITGATGALGSTIVEALAPRFRCVALFRDAAKFDQLRAREPALEGIACDLSDEDGIAEAFARADPWAVVHLAGSWTGGTLAATTDDAWSWQLEVNLTVAFRVLRESLRSLPRGGRFVAIASAAALDNRTGMAAYVVAKAALLAMLRNAAAEAEGRLSINAIAPDAIAPTGSSPSSGVDPRELTATIEYLLSPGAGAVNGAVIPMWGARPLPNADARGRGS